MASSGRFIYDSKLSLPPSPSFETVNWKDEQGGGVKALIARNEKRAQTKYKAALEKDHARARATLKSWREQFAFYAGTQWAYHALKNMTTPVYPQTDWGKLDYYLEVLRQFKGRDRAWRGRYDAMKKSTPWKRFAWLSWVEAQARRDDGQEWCKELTTAVVALKLKGMQ